ncbi:hypothetical protein D3C86_1448110 [compost metagenome]
MDRGGRLRALEEPVCGRAGKVVFQARDDLADADLRLVVDKGVARAVAVRAALDRHVRDAHVLGLSAAADLQRAVHAGRRGAGPLEDLQRALPLHMRRQQEAAELFAGRGVRLDTVLDAGAPVEEVARIEQRGADVRVHRRARDDGERPESGVRIERLKDRRHLHDADLTPRTGHGADVLEDGIAGPVGDHLGGRRAAALGHVVHDLRLDNLDVGFVDGHG